MTFEITSLIQLIFQFTLSLGYAVFLLLYMELFMNYDMIVLVSKLRQVENMEQLQDVKDFAETVLRREKNYALLTLMAVADEFGESEITETLDKLRNHLHKL